MRSVWQIGVACILLMAALSAQAVTPKIKRVALEEFTTLTLKVVPDLGVRFVFPFILDEQDDYVPFTLNITNPMFSHDRKNGRNSFVVTVPPPPQGGQIPTYYSNMFITVAGYNISVTLTTTSDLTQHVSDVVFDLTESARQDLIQQAVEKRIKAIKDEYAAKESALEHVASDMTLKRIGGLALSGPSRKRINEETTTTTLNGDRLVLFLDDLQRYGEFHLFSYEVQNDSSQPLRVNDAALFLVDEAGIEQRINTANTVHATIDAESTVRGVIVTDDVRVLDGKHIKFSVLTDQGPLEVKW
ncbi:MAG: Uncharacterized protein FD165_2675 [Gammaproteobacteria bacterium]|nr:MAG: Uncharacterized protein FD165_2675 [Gammaproteobacteria bacterium]TND01148.1 MAG: Uncharacterized protein FD120_2684 [Gammaproteobacteria bacterium]